MTQKIYMVIVNCGDGCNGIQILKTEKALARVQELASEGRETYASGDGIQSRELTFPDEFALDAWVTENFYGYDDDAVLNPVFDPY